MTPRVTLPPCDTSILVIFSQCGDCFLQKTIDRKDGDRTPLQNYKFTDRHYINTIIVHQYRDMIVVYRIEEVDKFDRRQLILVEQEVIEVC